MKKGIFGLLTITVLFGFAGTHGEANETTVEPNIVEVAREAGAFNTLLTAVEAAGLTETLATGGPFTVFAPTDQAFAKIPAETLNEILADKEKLTAILLHHVVEGAVPSSAVVDLSSATTLNGTSLPIMVSDAGVKVGEAMVVTVDVEADNGIIHVIDTVLLP